MRNDANTAGCLTGAVTFFIRLLILFYWIARPVQFNATFSTFIIPCLGFLFLPLTTLMYILLAPGVQGLQGLDWLWIILAVILDILMWGSAGITNRNRIPAGYPGSTQTPTP
jgi:hypothetical protein